MLRFGTKIQAMVRITDETDRLGGSSFPTFMYENMRGWEREGLIKIERNDRTGSIAKITDKGRALAKKAM